MHLSSPACGTGRDAAVADRHARRLQRAHVTHEGGQIRMEEFQVLIPPTPRWLLQMAIELAAVAVFAVFFVASVVTILNNLRNQTPTLEMPFWLFMAPLALGSLLLIIETTAIFIHTFRRGRPEAKQTILT
jgi:TRAP-type C4-dicarboxylate transport system permease small subunit